MNYLLYATNAYLLYKVNRENIKGKEILKTLEKYYVVDPGFYSLLVDDEDKDIGFLLENIIYLELLRRGYVITIGKIDKNEIDFICKKNNVKIYVQVSDSIMNEKPRKESLKH